MISKLFSIILMIVTCQAMSQLKWFEVLTPFLYLGDTPYQNQTFNSPNISAALHIQRDLAINVTIDQLVWPAIDMTTAFFGMDYSSTNVNNMDQPLRMGYRRLNLDIYYDPNRQNWQFCPIAVNNATETLGTYNCSSTFLLQDYLDKVNTYLVSTEAGRASLLTNIITLILNLHSNTSVTTNLSSIIQNSISRSTYELAPRLYTPANLSEDRTNSSFLAHTPYMVSQQQTDWPPWLHLIQEKVQLLVGFGTLDSTITISDVDKSMIFDSSSLNAAMNLSAIPDTTAKIPSWSFINDNQTRFTYISALSTVQSGYSPYFTHSNYSGNNTFYSSIDTGHLADNILTTIWSWDVNEPNTSNPDSRCAAMALNGRWQALDCTAILPVACRLATTTNTWILTNTTYNYDRALSACPSNYIFDVPRVPTQNTALASVVKQANVSKIWLNLNLLEDVEGCWVIGRHDTCWWDIASGTEFIGLIRTSIVSGVIILIVVSIFTWVKCTRLYRNRNNKSRKAFVKAMLARREYVTIPA